MSLADLQQYISTPYIYGNVTSDQIAALTVPNYVTVINGITFVGTYDPVDTLSSQALS